MRSSQFNKNLFQVTIHASRLFSKHSRYSSLIISLCHIQWCRRVDSKFCTDTSATFFANEAVSWSSLGLSVILSRVLSNAGLARPSLVQAACIPSILSGKDVVCAAETGSGKTHAYLIPLINKICNLQDDSKDLCQGVTYFKMHFLILCPNSLLCEQVARMTSGLCDESGKPYVRVAAVYGRRGWPVNCPEVIVSTPATLMNAIKPNKKWRFEFMRVVKYVVFDEADMLLCGGFQNEVFCLINMLRQDEMHLSHSNDGSSKQGIRTVFAKGKDRTDGGKYEDWKKQFIFVAATLPENGKKTAGAVLKRMFPNAMWVVGEFLHHHNPRLKHRWIEVAVDTQVDVLTEAVKNISSLEASNLGDGVNRTMVFVNTGEAVELIAKIFDGAGIECFRYHKDCPSEAQAKVLLDFQHKGGIFVCTDAGARGLDIPHVTHVIQADFASSAVSFLHRVGRTARAGMHGHVTSLYTHSDLDLVNAIQQAQKLNEPMVSAFSRKRSFRRKMKKKKHSDFFHDGSRGDCFVMAIETCGNEVFDEWYWCFSSKNAYPDFLRCCHKLLRSTLFSCFFYVIIENYDEAMLFIS